MTERFVKQKSVSQRDQLVSNSRRRAALATPRAGKSRSVFRLTSPGVRFAGNKVIIRPAGAGWKIEH